jgi:hypothetical protein
MNVVYVCYDPDYPPEPNRRYGPPILDTIDESWPFPLDARGDPDATFFAPTPAFIREEVEREEEFKIPPEYLLPPSLGQRPE